ncbi:hypothetical protein XM25_08005 [Devosia sp. H5989]|nr:hypothetical protein XM25_08005 [Devosia sp. H5989]
MDFITALRSHTRRASYGISFSAPPCGGIGVREWDHALGGTFAALCLKDTDQARLHHLDLVARNYERRVGVVAEADPGNTKVIGELDRCARLLRQWQADLRDDSILRRAA